MITYYGSSISPNQVETAEGFLICRNVPIARIGPQDYLARELQLDGDPNRMVKVNRYEADVFDKATVASFEGKPVTDTHPDEAVSPDNFSKLAAGHAQNVRREGDFIVADLYINDASLIDDIRSGKKREVSCGYLCNYEPDGDDYKQTNIRGNHVAVVQSGRAGHEVAIKDAAAKTAEERTQRMSKFSKTVLTAFGIAAKDANEDELKNLTNLAVTALDSEPAEPAEKAPEEEKEAPAKEAEDEMVEKAPKGDDLGSKLDKVIEMLSAVLKKEVKDEEPEEEETEDEEPEELAEDEEAEEKSEVIEEEKTEDGCGAKDAAEFLKAIRPAINSISDKKQRSAVSKAILSAVKDADMSAIFKTAGSAAQEAADASSKTTYEKRCEVQMNAYAAHNPHTKKEEK